MSFPVPKYVCTACDWVGYAAMVGKKRDRLPSGGYLNISRMRVVQAADTSLGTLAS